MFDKNCASFNQSPLLASRLCQSGVRDDAHSKNPGSLQYETVVVTGD
jgi:hypothetical protein